MEESKNCFLGKGVLFPKQRQRFRLSMPGKHLQETVTFRRNVSKDFFHMGCLNMRKFNEMIVCLHQLFYILYFQAGADVNIKRFDGNTSLHIACGRGNVGMVALLMAGGADPNIENDDVESSDDDDSFEEENNNDKEKVSVDTTKEALENNKDDAKENTPRCLQETNVKNEDQSRDTDDKVGSKTYRKGLLPADFADGNEKVSRLLVFIFCNSQL